MENSVADHKSVVRQHHHILRRSLLDTQWKELSSRITDQLLKTEEFRLASTVHTYVSMKSNREVFTLDLIETILELGKKVLVPRMQSNGKLSHHLISSLDSLEKNKWGVLEPSSEKPTDLPDDSLIIVPMVAADFDRNRLGYGKGYYDRFLESVTATKVGLCFNMNLSWVPLPVESFDVKMDRVITEQFIL
jgi:5-formyltetrahydrofolate cyclo-ligase